MNQTHETKTDSGIVLVSLMVDIRLFPDDTVHLSHTSTLFGTQASLILDIAIDAYSITQFSILFLYFIIKVKPRLEIIQGAPPSHQTVGNVGNGIPSRLLSPRARKGGYGKISAVYPTASNTGILRPSFFVLLLPTRILLTFSLLIPHGADRLHTALLPPLRQPQYRDHHWDTKHPGCLGLYAVTGHMGSGTRNF